MKIKVLFLMLFTVLLITGMSFASDVVVSVNDKVINHDDLVIQESGIVYGLAAEFAERMGVEVDWLENAKIVVLKIGEDYVNFQVDSNVVLVNNKEEKMQYNAILDEGRVYVPLAVLTEKLGIQYDLDEDLIYARLKHESFKVQASEVRKVNFTEEDVLWLARIIQAETRSGSLDKKIAVANVVLNRVASPSFPNTIYDVIFQRGQFPPAYKSGFSTMEPSESCVIAAKRALLGVVVAEDCLFFNCVPFPNKANSFYKLIEGDYFYR